VSGKRTPRFRALSASEVRANQRVQTLLRVSVSSFLVTKVGAWVVRPAIGVDKWSCTLPSSGMRAGTFPTRHQAETFARRLVRRVPKVRTLRQWMALPQGVRDGLAALRESILEAT
jgi:hypothetical protein